MHFYSFIFTFEKDKQKIPPLMRQDLFLSTKNQLFTRDKHQSVPLEPECGLFCFPYPQA